MGILILSTQKNHFIGNNISKRGYRGGNKVIFNDNLCEIELYDKYGKIRAKTIIDIQDYDKIKKYRWTFDGRYVLNVRERIYLHHLILGFKKLHRFEEVDHINGNGLDNRRNNLRICTHSQNLWNSNKMKNNKSGYKGISWCKFKKKWRTVLSFNKIYKHVGYFATTKEAIFALEQARIKYHGEFANFG